MYTTGPINYGPPVIVQYVHSSKANGRNYPRVFSPIISSFPGGGFAQFLPHFPVFFPRKNKICEI